jgi:ribosome-associated toxin RatA of RatAB toxin-antitoxin module
MPDRTESTIVIGAPPSAVLEVIADFEAYPEWTGAVKRAEVLTLDDADRPVSALFELDAGAIRDTYTLDYTWNVDAAGVGSLSWTLHEPSTVLKALDGTYELHPTGDATAVRYALAVDLRIPMLGMLRRKAEKVIIDTALNELKKRVEGDAEGSG